MTTQPPEKAAPEEEGAVAKPRAVGFPDLRDEVDRLWETVMAYPWRPFRALDRIRPTPAMDVFEKDGTLHVRAELPGMSEKDVDIEITNEALTITGEKKEEREVKEDNYYRSERTYGRFSRQVALPAGADTDNARAELKNGVLEIDIPIKAAEAKKRLEIKGVNAA